MFFWKINKITSRSTSTNVNELNNSFAWRDADKQREIARKGENTAHERTVSMAYWKMYSG